MDRYARDHIKDKSPEQTIASIKSALKDFGLEVEQTDASLDIEGCYSCRIHLAGELSPIGANGKGVSRSYGLASGYAEFMERLQNGILAVLAVPGDELGGSSLYQTAEENSCFKSTTIDAEAKKEGSLVDWILTRAEPTVTEAPTLFSTRDYLKLLLKKALLNCYGQTAAAPYYELSQKEYCFESPLPIHFLCGSNGMAAGNTREEAFVQAVSEIFERYATKRIIEEGLTPPEIPAPVLARYPYVVDVIRRMEADGKYKVKVFDASLGLGLPVAGCCIFDLQTGKLGIRFGAHPNLAVALERNFTESLQGRTLQKCANTVTVAFDRQMVEDISNTRNMFAIGYGYVHYQTLSGVPSWSWSEWEQDGVEDNKRMTRKLARQALELGGKVYVADATSLGGVYALQVIMPDISVAFPPTESRLKQAIREHELAELMRNSHKISAADARKIISYLLYYGPRELRRNSLNYLYGLPMKANPELPNCVACLCSLCYYRLGDHENAVAYMRRSTTGGGEADKRLDFGLLQYLQAKAAGLSGAETEAIVRQTIDAERAERIIAGMSDPQTVIAQFFPPVLKENLHNADKPDSYAEVLDIMERVWQKRLENGENALRIHEIFE